MRLWYQRKTPEERRAIVAKRDPERVRAADRQRYRENPERRNPTARRDPVRRKASMAVYNAIRRGKLIRPEACSECGAACRPDAHHDDYAKPLEVVWLCRPCHMARHKKPEEDFVGLGI